MDMGKILEGNIKLFKMIVKMIYQIVISALDIFEECRKKRAIF